MKRTQGVFDVLRRLHATSHRAGERELTQAYDPRRASSAAPFRGVLLCVALAVSAAGAIAVESGSPQEGIDWQAGLEATYHTNASLATTAQKDFRLVYYGELDYGTSSSRKTFQAGLKGRFADYMDLDSADNGELQGFASMDIEGARGTLGTQFRIALLNEVAGQDLLILERLRRTRIELGAGWEADFQKTSLVLDAGFDMTQYVGSAWDSLDHRGPGVGIRLGRKWSRTDVGFKYRRVWVDYPDPAREDFTSDNFGLGVRYDLRSHLTLDAGAGYTMVRWDTGDGGTGTGFLKATYSVDEQRTLLMFSLERQILPSSIAVYNADLRLDLSLRREFNGEMDGEIALSYESGRYNDGTKSSRFQIGGGVSLELGSRTAAYLRASRTIYGDTSGGPPPADYTVVTLGFDYGF